MRKSIVFPGQGSQYLGMGKYLFDNFKSSKLVFEEVDCALNQKLSNIIFGEDKNILNLTENTQPAIMTVSIATFEALKEIKGIEVNNFSFTAGHSLGEYSALVASDSLKLPDAAKILKKRGQAMQAAVPVGKGSMAAILNVDVNELESYIREKKLSSVEIASDNCPGQCVISGIKDDVEKISSELKDDRKKKTILLPVSAPFHCKLMIPAAKELNEFFKKFKLLKPSIPIISNVSASPEEDSENIKKLLIKCVFSRVRWRETVEFLSNQNISKSIECGPGKALTNMFKRFKFDMNCLKIDNLEDIQNYE